VILGSFLPADGLSFKSGEAGPELSSAFINFENLTAKAAEKYFFNMTKLVGK